MRGTEDIPLKILLYLLDLPDENGYAPVDDNSRPRVRLIKYLFYDGKNPLAQPLPTPKEKLSMLFDPDCPVLNSDAAKKKHPKGYRLFWQRAIGQSQTEAQSKVCCYMGRIYSSGRNPFETEIGIRFDIGVNVNLETNLGTNSYERSYNIEQCLREALNGVNFAGIGTISFARADHADNGSVPIWDESTNIGRSVHCSLSWAESDDA